MAEDERPASGVVPRLVQEFTAQLGAITGRLEDLAGLGGGKPPAPGALPLPGGLSAAQMTSIADSIAAQRRSVAALKAQLSSFDEQLAVLEQILGPLAEWSRTWAELERRPLNLGRSPGAGKATPAGSSPGSPLQACVTRPAARGRQRPAPQAL